MTLQCEARVRVAVHHSDKEMDWRKTLLDFARVNGLPVWEFDEGIGVDFSNECDAFWVLPGEMASLKLPVESRRRLRQTWRKAASAPTLSKRF